MSILAFRTDSHAPQIPGHHTPPTFKVVTHGANLREVLVTLHSKG